MDILPAVTFGLAMVSFTMLRKAHLAYLLSPHQRTIGIAVGWTILASVLATMMHGSGGSDGDSTNPDENELDNANGNRPALAHAAQKQFSVGENSGGEASSSSSSSSQYFSFSSALSSGNPNRCITVVLLQQLLFVAALLARKEIREQDAALGALGITVLLFMKRKFALACWDEMSGLAVCDASTTEFFLFGTISLGLCLFAMTRSPPNSRIAALGLLWAITFAIIPMLMSHFEVLGNWEITPISMLGELGALLIVKMALPGLPPVLNDSALGSAHGTDGVLPGSNLGGNAGGRWKW